LGADDRDLTGNYIMKNIGLITILLFGLVTAVNAGDFLSKEDFANKYASVVESMHPEAKAEVVNELEVGITLPDGRELTSFLDNAYTDYKNNPKDIDNVLTAYAEALNLSTDFENVKFSKDQIVPVIKDRLYLEQAEELLNKSEKKTKLVYEKLNNTLYVFYAFDTPTSIRYMTEDDLRDIGIKESELRDLSKSNLKKSIPDLELEGDPAALSMLVADGTYEASFILFDEIWTKEQFPVKGNIVVYIPTRDVVLITGSEDDANLAKVRDLIYNKGSQWSHFITEVGFVRVDDRWQEYRP
jgi:uncharacterized protein YtpQ (UPF0354 family)